MPTDFTGSSTWIYIYKGSDYLLLFIYSFILRLSAISLKKEKKKKAL